MSKEITKAFILQEMQDKFKLRDFEHEKFIFSETVVPTYNIGQHVQKHEAKFKVVSITSAAAFEFFVVPDNERWTLHRYVGVFMGAGAIKMTGLYIARAHQTSYPIYLDMTRNQTVSYMKDLPKSVVLNDGDTINMYCDDYTTTQDFRLYIDVTVEEIR